jgi:outer membrane beta-barrel protein
MRTHPLLVSLLLVAVAGTASADRKRNRLDDEPAVRQRLLLVKGRFEFSPQFESTINADFRHTIGVGGKLEYHLSDMLSFGVIGLYGTSINTALVGKITDTLETDPDGDGMCSSGMAMVACDATREPSKEEFLQHLNKMPLHGAAYVSLTPWYGKLAAFSTAFVNFDFYFQAGVSFAQLKSECDDAYCSDMRPGQPGDDPDGGGPLEPPPPDDNPNNDPPLNDGSKVGLYLAGGLHVFINDFIALDLSVRDYAFTDNPSGADYNADLFVCDSGRFDCASDNRFLHHLFVGVGASVMFPMTAKRTR